MIIRDPFDNNDQDELDSADIELSDALPKHSYPLWVRVYIVCTILFTVPLIAYFWMHEMPRHCEVHADFMHAERLFKASNYEQAQLLYAKIVQENPACKKGYLRLSQIFFAGSADDDQMYNEALALLACSECTDEEFPEVYAFMPATRKEEFMSLLTSSESTESSIYDLPDSWRAALAFDLTRGCAA